MEVFKPRGRWGFEPPGLGKFVPASGESFGTRLSLKSFFQPKPFCDNIFSLRKRLYT